MLLDSLLIRHWLTERAICANRSTILDKLLHLLSTCKDRGKFAQGGRSATGISALRILPVLASFGTAGSTVGAEPPRAMQQAECCCVKRPGAAVPSGDRPAGRSGALGKREIGGSARHSGAPSPATAADAVHCIRKANPAWIQRLAEFREQDGKFNAARERIQAVRVPWVPVRIVQLVDQFRKEEPHDGNRCG